MKKKISRRGAMGIIGGALTGMVAASPGKAAKETVKNELVSTGAPKDYNPNDHKWIMAFDIDRCIGCGLCVKACKAENNVPRQPTFFRTWIERYKIKRATPGSGHLRGETLVDSPNGGYDGFPAFKENPDDILHSFFVPKFCNLCESSPCVQACPVGATFDAPDGAVLIDPSYCIGCGFCIQTCPYGCRFMSPETHTAEKCTLCYHRITRGLKPACVEACPAGARIFGDLKHMEEDDPIFGFIEGNKVQSLKPHLGTHPRVVYAGMDKEVR